MFNVSACCYLYKANINSYKSLNFVGVAKGEDALRMKVNEIIAAGVASGDINRMSEKWLKRPAGDLPK